MPIIMNKLTTEVKCNLAREHSNSQWILTDLMAALQKEIRILESGLHDPYNPTPKITTAGLQVGARNRMPARRKDHCVYFAKEHIPHMLVKL